MFKIHIIETSVSIVGFKIIKINNRQLQIVMTVFYTNIYFMFSYLLFFRLVFFLSAHFSSPWSNILRWNSTTLMNTPGGATLLEDSLRSLQRSWFLCGCCTLWVSLQDHWDRYCHTLLLSCYCYLSDNSFKIKNNWHEVWISFENIQFGSVTWSFRGRPLPSQATPQTLAL